MTKKICVTSTLSMGCTFIDWSIHFLSGQSQFFNVLLNQWIDLSSNPITPINAHGHNKNHPSGFIETQEYLDKLNLLSNDTIYSMYPGLMRFDTVAKQLNIDTNQLEGNRSVLDQIVQYMQIDYNKIFDLCNENQIKIVYVDMDPRMVLYHQNFRNLDLFMFKQDKPKSVNELEDEIQEIFFKSSQTTWQELNLTNVWDVRERLALDTRPFDVLFSECKFEKTYPHLWINCLDLWTRTASTISKIMQYIELEIDEDRFRAWLPVCHQWQQHQLTLVEFCYNQPHIVDAIVNNLYYEINLTFRQEVIIQHCLIYQHGLNLKTWQLEKFPNNTQDLHKLLEPNIHLVPDIYSRLTS